MNVIEAPVVEVDKDLFILHSYVSDGKVTLSREEATLLLIELYKFVNEHTTTN